MRPAVDIKTAPEMSGRPPTGSGVHLPSTQPNRGIPDVERLDVEDQGKLLAIPVDTSNYCVIGVRTHDDARYSRVPRPALHSQKVQVIVP